MPCRWVALEAFQVLAGFEAPPGNIASVCLCSGGSAAT
jgi:hypothetical protein